MKWFWPFLSICLVNSLVSAQRDSREENRSSPERVRPALGASPMVWDERSAAHLMRRAGFSAPRSELERIEALGLQGALDELLFPELVDDSEMEEALGRKSYPLVTFSEEDDLTYPDGLNLNRRWLFRMIQSRRQLQERMTLFWHDHFATSLSDVFLVDCFGQGPNCPAGLPLVQIQNETLRQHALGNFKDLVRAISEDPAMIIFLDNFSNVAGAPNENWARELLELFTMGEGRGYTETDIQEAARAFTGWTLDESLHYYYNPFVHDHHYPKSVLGRTIDFELAESFASQGKHDAEKVLDFIFERVEVGEFLATKLWEFFVYPEPEARVVRELGLLFRNSGYDLKTLMRAIFSHPQFLSEKAYRAKIKSPVEMVVNFFREAELRDPDNLPPFMFFLSLGQILFLPPNVGGWVQDRAWINTGTTLGRFNLLNFVIANRPGLFDGGELVPADDKLDLEATLQTHGLVTGTQVVEHFLSVLVQGDVSYDTRQTLEEYLDSGPGGAVEPFDSSDPVIVDRKVRGLIHLITLLPVYQLN